METRVRCNLQVFSIALGKSFIYLWTFFRGWFQPLLSRCFFQSCCRCYSSSFQVLILRSHETVNPDLILFPWIRFSRTYTSFCFGRTNFFSVFVNFCKSHCFVQSTVFVLITQMWWCFPVDSCEIHLIDFCESIFMSTFKLCFLSSATAKFQSKKLFAPWNL